MAPISYSEVLARNIRGSRNRAGLKQEDLAARMHALGFTAWRSQVVANVENNKRRVTAEEVHGLAWSLETTIAALMSPSDQDESISFPNGHAIGVVSVQRLAGRGANDHAVHWTGTNSPTLMVLGHVPGTDVFERGEFLEQLHQPGTAPSNQASAQQSPEAEEAP